MTVLSEKVLGEIRELPHRYPQPRSAVMPALDLAQEEVGHLTPETMSEVATALDLDPGYVEGVATFYSLFHLEPVGKHRFYICTNLSCMIRGAEEIVEHFREVTGVKDPTEVSADGLFSYDAVECLGACEYAPMMRLDHRYHYDLTNEKIDSLLAERRGAPQPHRGPAPLATPQPHPSPPPHAGEGTHHTGSPPHAREGTGSPGPHPGPGPAPLATPQPHPGPPPRAGEGKERRKPRG